MKQIKEEVLGVLLIVKHGTPLLLSHLQFSKSSAYKFVIKIVKVIKILKNIQLNFFSLTLIIEIFYIMPMLIFHCRTRHFLAIIHSGLHWLAFGL